LQQIWWHTHSELARTARSMTAHVPSSTLRYTHQATYAPQPFHLATIHNTIRPSSNRQRGKTGVKKMKPTLKCFESEHVMMGIAPALHDLVLIDEQACGRPQCPVYQEHGAERRQRLETLSRATCWSTTGVMARLFSIRCWHAIYMSHKANSDQKRAESQFGGFRTMDGGGRERTANKASESHTMWAHCAARAFAGAYGCG